MPNHLINETSPYLLQHLHQPVDWYPYSDEVFEKARNEDKPLIISIGYSTCHWCHVMAHQCFDNTEIADIMNQYFISVKVDREELPDVDKYYMNAMQVLTGRGGWPLNAFVLPNKKMFYAVTYLPPEQWKNLLIKIHHLYVNEQEKLVEYAENLHQGLVHFELSALQNKNDSLDKSVLTNKVNEWKSIFDKEWGGHSYVPKFVMPVNYKFLLMYNYFFKDEEVRKHLQLSMSNIALGGLFDHIGGGFYRYSTDRFWKVPHFEKMLYDNAQMIELLSLYYLNFNEEEIKWIVEKNIRFVLNEMRSSEHLFYSALDADSDGEEGKFYVWTIDELKFLLKDEYDAFADIFNINNHFGYWEESKFVLTINRALFLSDKKKWMNKIDEWTQKLQEYRNKRTKPNTDTKIITSWNSLMIKAFCTAYLVFKRDEYLHIAEESLKALLNKVYINQQLFRIYHSGQTKIPAYLEDYTFLIDALINVAKITGNTEYLNIAQNLSEQVIELFYSKNYQVFYFTNYLHPVEQSVELYDDVIPSSQAQMIQNLNYLSTLNDNLYFKDIANAVFQKTEHLFEQQFYHAASYGSLLLQKQFLRDIEIAIVGTQAPQYLRQVFSQIWFLNTIYTSTKPENYSIFKDRFYPQKTFIYVCQHFACYEPIEDISTFGMDKYFDISN